eukprot:snap_masked-scaffold_39-processed-gene-1.50-mRNA-1 protein AED:0.21 eAED:1.00 QI:0/-1/0/1/-1/1/1/0/316
MCSSFEGVEKLLFVSAKPGKSLLTIPENIWSEILSHAKCSILSSRYTKSVNSFVLSESSLFVFEDSIYVKTCGTTTLLQCLKPLIEQFHYDGLEVDCVEYSHKNFLFPENQQPEYQNFMDEISLLKEILNESLQSYDSGKVKLQNFSMNTGEDYFKVVKYGEMEKSFKRVNLMMFGLDKTSRELFYSENNSCERIRKEINLPVLCGQDYEPAQHPFDDYLFEICGYSMNNVSHENFYTIHVTPEADCSYASMETNVHFETPKQMEYWVESVIKEFKPSKTIVVCSGYPMDFSFGRKSDYDLKRDEMYAMFQIMNEV